MSTPSLTPKERQQIQQLKGTLQQQQDKKTARLGALARTLTSTDRILTGRRDLAVVFGSQLTGSFQGAHAHIPAYTDGKRIAINDAIIPDIRTKNGLVTTLGLNYHELAHNLFTPGSGSNLVSGVRADGIFSTFNLLEDQRIESLLVAKYRSAAKFLSAPVLEFIIKDDKTWATAHLFVYGRRFLPKDVRKELRDVFNGNDRTRIACESLIDEYRGMDLSHLRNHQRAFEIVQDLHKILVDELNLTPEEEQAMQEHSGCGGVGDRNGSFTNDLMKIREETETASRRRDEDDAAQEEEEKAQEGGEDVEDIDDDEDGPEEQPEGDAGNIDDDSEDDGDDISDEDDDEDGDGGEDDEEDLDSEDGSDGVSGDESEGDDEGGEGSSPGGPSGGDAGDVGDDGDASGDDSHGSVDVEDGDEGGSGAGVGDGSDDLEEILAAALAELEGDSEVEDEVSRLQGAMDDDNLMDTLLADATWTDTPVEADEINTASSVMRELQKLNTQFEAGWHYGSDHGRLNPQLAMTADWGDTDIFDHWEEGREMDAALEAYITVDRSSSMKGGYGEPNLIESACKALWVTKRALDDVDAITTVTTFNSGDPEKLYGRGEQADHNTVRQLQASGGTAPRKAFEEGRRILNVSERPNKLFVVITDGEWSGILAGNQGEKNNLAALQSIKGTRVYIGLGQKCEDVYREAFDVIAVIQKPSDIVEVIQRAVVSMLDEAIKMR